MGDIEVWNRAETLLEDVLKNNQIEYSIDPGEAAFYGPKLDFQIRDSLNRDVPVWQLCNSTSNCLNDLTSPISHQMGLKSVLWSSIAHFAGVLNALSAMLIEALRRRIPDLALPHSVRCDDNQSTLR